MGQHRYALAKYVRNTRRGEPINIGLFLQTPHGIEARFLGESNSTEEVRGRFNDWNVYCQWIAYWRKTIDELGEDEDFIARINEGNRQSFFVVEAGRLLDKVSANDVQRLADQLFAELVL